METVQVKSQVKNVKVDGVDVFLEDYELGKGKITISSLERGAFTYYWGAMGSNLIDFIKRISGDYFTGKLCSEGYVIDPKASARSVRWFIRKDMSYELPYYKFMSAQKEMREKIKELEQCSSDDEFVVMMHAIPDNLMCYDLSYQEEKEFKDIIKGVFECEPWNFIVKKTTDEYNWLTNFHKRLKKEL